MYLLQIEYMGKKKAEGKKARDDKDAVLNMLFAAFEKHQYYNIKDLQKVIFHFHRHIFVLCSSVSQIYLQLYYFPDNKATYSISEGNSKRSL